MSAAEENEMRLKGKRAIVTAGASGMGRAGVELFAREGAQVVAIDINPAVMDVAGALGGSAHGVVADMGDAGKAKQGLERAVSLLGGVDILWNHFGVPGSASVEDITQEEFDFSLRLNILSGLVGSGTVIPHMKNGGSIIFTASVSGLVGSPLSPLYSAAKSGVVGMAKSLALRYAAQGIRVNVICPGPVDTPMLVRFASRTGDAAEAEQNKAKLLTAIPLGRLGQAHDVAHAALWLASDDSAFVTGVALPVDGGYTAR